MRAWARELPANCDVLDLGCGHGFPISQTLSDVGHRVFGIEASPTLTAAFQQRFPTYPVACEPVETSQFFKREFPAVISWGLLFLLPGELQNEVIRRVTSALESGGRLLFTAPTQVGSWTDIQTGHLSVSLGAAAYRRAVADAGLTLLAEHGDEGSNHYYDAVKP